jgi:hypothetical protein
MRARAFDRAVLSRGLAQMAQLVGTYDSKTDQTAQSDQGVELADQFGCPSWRGTDQPESETDQRNCPATASSCPGDRRASRLYRCLYE